MKSSAVDIIVPVYNAYDATKECIYSVLVGTDLTFHSLILINDCSTDKRIQGLLEEFYNNNSDLNIRVMNNETNLGFVGTVNRGMNASKNDVLLLNSDTVVSKGWIEKICECAYSDKSIGTVTPLSNNATLVSVPNGLCRNEVLDNISLEEYNTLIEKCSYKEYPELPTAHGFCMFIKREVLELVGLFDEKTFGTGYGEENDFSFRCLDYGYKNVMCDTTLVYHKESQSFNSQREVVLEEHLSIIKKRYPQYSFLIDSWCHNFPIKHICENIKVNLNLYKRKNVLTLIHEWDNTTGGTSLHLTDIISQLRKSMNFHVLYPQGNKYILHSYFENEETVLRLPYTVNKFTAFARWNNDYRSMVKDIISAYGIDTLHIHHTVGHFFDIIDVAKEYGVYSVITLHDYYSVCPNLNLLYCGDRYCRNEQAVDCQKCLIETKRASNDITAKWRADWKEFLEKFDRVIVPSDDAKSIVSQYYDTVNTESIEHGIELSKSDYLPQISDTFNVAFIGVMCKHKGGLIISDIIKKCNNGKIHFHVFGKSELAELTQNTSNYTFHGAYQRENLNNLLHENNINLICFLQIWPETYSYTLNEAIGAGIPVLTTNIGAGKDRVNKYKFGWVIDSLKPTEIIKKITEISENRTEYGLAIKAIADYEIKTVAYMGKQYYGIYSNGTMREPDYAVLADVIKTQNRNCESGSNAEYELSRITNSVKWRIISKVRIPRKLRRVIRFVYLKLKKLKRG